MPKKKHSAPIGDVEIDTTNVPEKEFKFNPPSRRDIWWMSLKRFAKGGASGAASATVVMAKSKSADPWAWALAIITGFVAGGLVLAPAKAVKETKKKLQSENGGGCPSLWNVIREWWEAVRATLAFIKSRKEER